VEYVLFKLRHRNDTTVAYSDGPAYYIHLLDLTRGPERLFSKFHSTSVRQRIRRAEKSGLEVQYADTEAAVRTFYDMLVSLRKRNGLPPQPFRFYRNIWRIMAPRGLASFPMVVYDSRVIACGLVLHGRKMVHLEYSASDDRYLSLGPNQIMIWKIIKGACEAQCMYLDLGRTAAANRSLLEFKDRWAADRYPLYYTYYPNLEHGTRQEAGARWSLMRSINRRLPARLLELEGNVLYRHLAE
jgi:lipid II:glycine glycyltransferase (peptidoglycan interpeptide bridge formation enzyme)